MTNQNKIRHDSIDFFRQFAESKNGKCLSETYTNSKTKILYECKNGHQFYALPSNTKKGHWCHRCSALEKAKLKKDSIELFKNIAENKGGKCLSENYSSQKDQLLFECEKGHQWYATAGKVKVGDWCRKCSYEVISKKNKLDIKILIETAKKKGGRLLSTTYVKASEKLLWECSEKHQWWTSAQNVRAGNWCKKCSSKKAAAQLKKSIEDCNNLANQHNGFCLSKTYVHSQSNLIWQCKSGHTWEASYANVKKGTWCKICSNKKRGIERRTPIDWFKEYAIAKGGICLSDKYLNQKSVLKFQCEKGHIWDINGGSIKGRETWCPKCAGTYKADTPELKEERLNEIKEIAQKNGGECLSAEYINQKTKLKFKCEKGHIWETVSSVIKSGSWCKRCASSKANDWKRDTIDVYKKIVENKGGKLHTQEYKSSAETKLLIECDKGHKWVTYPGHIKKGLWCRKCNGSAPHTLEDVRKLVESRGGKLLSNTYKNDMTKVLCMCAENHIWEVTPNNMKRGKWCPTCNSGIGERVCRLAFEKIFQRHFNKVRPEWLRNNSGNVMELDGYNKELKLAFEHQGTQHYSEKSNHRFVKENLAQNDKEKFEICNSRGVSIVYIPEVFTDTKLNDLIPFILQQLDNLNIPYSIEAAKLVLDPREVYTYTKTKEVQIREERALQILQESNSTLLDIFRDNNGVKVKTKCSNNHIGTISIGTILNGTVCKKCLTNKKIKRAIEQDKPILQNDDAN
ncbi:MAG TPA: hypothetical protein VFM99_09390 [Chitinophagales bacterium]|nr:hypothetical protein [Chitinophagales bacterium]